MPPSPDRQTVVKKAEEILTKGCYGKKNTATRLAAKTVFENPHHTDGDVDDQPPLPVKLNDGSEVVVFAKPTIVVKFTPPRGNSVFLINTQPSPPPDISQA